MPKFEVLSSEKVFYKTIVEAKDAEEASRLVTMDLMDLGKPFDSENFQVDEVKEVEGLEYPTTETKEEE